MGTLKCLAQGHYTEIMGFEPWTSLSGFCSLSHYQYHKVPKFLDTRKLCCNLPKIQEKRPNLRVFYQKDANVIANSEDPDQTAPGAVRSGSALFAQTYLSKNFGSLRYSMTIIIFCVCACLGPKSINHITTVSG